MNRRRATPQQAFDITLSDLSATGCGFDCGFIIPFDSAAFYGTRAQVNVCGTIDGTPFHATLTPYGGKHIMGVTQNIRSAIGKAIGDSVHLIMEADDEPRGLDIPEDLIWALDANEQAKAKFNKFALSHRMAYIEWIDGARKPETRQRRIEQAIDMIVTGKRKV